MPKQKFTDDELEKMLASGMKQKEIASKYGMIRNGVQARVSKLKKTDKPPERNGIDAVAIGQLIEYNGEKCKVVATSAGRIVFNTSSGQKIIKKEEHDCVCGIVVKKKDIKRPYRIKAIEENGVILHEYLSRTPGETTPEEEAEPEETNFEEDVRIYTPAEVREDWMKRNVQPAPTGFKDIIDMILERVKLTDEEREEAIRQAEKEKQTRFLASLTAGLTERMQELVS